MSCELAICHEKSCFNTVLSIIASVMVIFKSIDRTRDCPPANEVMTPWYGICLGLGHETRGQNEAELLVKERSKPHSGRDEPGSKHGGLTLPRLLPMLHTHTHTHTHTHSILLQILYYKLYIQQISERSRLYSGRDGPECETRYQFRYVFLSNMMVSDYRVCPQGSKAPPPLHSLANIIDNNCLTRKTW